MKPQLVAKRNAEIRRKEDANRLSTTAPDPEIQHSISSDRASRAREITIATTQGILGIILVLFGLLFISPVIGFLPLLLKTGPMAGAMVLFGGIGLVIFVLIGAALVRIGIRMLREAWFQQTVAPELRMLQKLSFDAVTVMAFTVGSGEVTNQVLFCFETEVGASGMLARLAEELSDPDILAEFTGDADFVPDRRRRIPEDLTDGLNIYLADLQVKHVVVSGKVRKRLALQCVAEPGPGGRIVVSQ